MPEVLALQPQVHITPLADDPRQGFVQGAQPMLCYLQPKGDSKPGEGRPRKPYPYAGHFSQDTNTCAPPIWFEPDAEYAPHQVPLTDIRGLPAASQPTLDVQGFEYASQPTKFFENGERKIVDEERLAAYCRELEVFMKERLGAEKVFVFEEPHVSPLALGRVGV